MKIGIDISQIVHKGTGVARFTNGLTNAILDFDKKNEWVFFFSSLRRNLEPHLEKKIISKGHRLIKWKLPPTLLSFLFNDLHFFFKYLISNITYLRSLDWFITSDWTEPALTFKKATIVHDLVYLRYPETVDQKILSTQKKRLDWVKKESNLIFADSQATKNDLTNFLKIDTKKISVIYPGVEVEKPTKEQINSTLKKYKLKKPFILTVGKLEPRKNLKRLIEAFSLLGDKKSELVVVGPKGWQNEDVQSINRLYNSSLDSNLKFLGMVNDEELYSLYLSCIFFAYPSIWEGFGYPPIEAMKLGTPVATSNSSSLKEIAENSALLF